MSTSKTLLSHVANIILISWVVPNGIRVYVLADNKVQSRSALFAILFTQLGVRDLTIIAYQFQTNEQVKQYTLDSHTTAALYCREMERLGHIHATNTVRVKRAGIKVHEHDHR